VFIVYIPIFGLRKLAVVTFGSKLPESISSSAYSGELLDGGAPDQIKD
jgi:hypothetical protein